MQKKIFIPAIILFISAVLLFSCNQAEKKDTTAIAATKKLSEFSATELYSEMEARNEVQNTKQLTDTPPVTTDPQLAEYSNKQLYEEMAALYGVYQYDNRKNIYDTSIKDKNVLNNAKRVACIIKASQLQLQPDGNYRLIPVRSYKKTNKGDLCTDERFYGEPVASFCTGFAVSKTMFATAGHCLNKDNLLSAVFIYGFSMKDSLTPNLVIKKEQVFKPVEVIGRELDDKTKSDFCIIKVDKEIPSGLICPISVKDKISDDQNLYVIGYPGGLPVKISSDGRVYRNDAANYFVTNLDTYGGNSGSPVFNANTHRVEGILVRGEDDYEWWDLEGCVRSKICPQDIGSCYGEHVSRPIQFKRWIK